jgi:hypothetical protein
MGYVCVDLVRTIHGLNSRMRQIAAHLGYHYAGLTRSNGLTVPEALLDYATSHRIELLIVPDLGHLRGRIPPDLAEITDIYDIATGRTHDRHGATCRRIRISRIRWRYSAVDSLFQQVR